MEQIVNNTQTILPLKTALVYVYPKARGSQDPMDNVTSFFAPLSLSTPLASIALIFKCPLFEWKPRIFSAQVSCILICHSQEITILPSLFLPYVKQNS